MTKEPNPPTPFPEKEGGVRGGTGEGSSPFLLREGYAQEGITSYLPSSAGVGLLRAASILILLLLLSLPACARPMTVGSKRFTESYILGEILTQLARSAGDGDATHKQGLGNTAIVYAALKRGDVDVYPDYTATIAQEILKDKKTGSLDQLNTEMEAQGIGVGIPLGFNDNYALAMREDVAQRLGIRTLSDLAKHPDLKLGFTQEFLGRADGWPGLKAAYKLPDFAPRGLDHGLAYAALNAGGIDVMDIYTTDAQLAKYKMRTLTDDRHFFPVYDTVLLYRLGFPQAHPKAWAAFQTLRGRIPLPRMIAMNAEADLRGVSFAAVAAEFLKNDLKVQGGEAAPRGGNGFWAKLFGPDFWPLTGQHLFLVFVSLFFSILVGVPLGIWAARRGGAAGPILSTVGLIQTIPSLALLAFLIPLAGTGALPALIALFLYSLLPIVRNTYTGLTDIPPALRESAQALGLPPGARLRLIELPLAARAIFAGIKTSAVINVGTATIAAFIGAGGYGERIVTGLATVNTDTILAGAIPAAALALLVQFGFDRLDRAVVPAGLRQETRT